MERSEAVLKSEQAQNYAIRLCKHFAHKREAHFEDGKGEIKFDLGSCLLSSTGDVLSIEILSADSEGLLKTQDVVERHLKRFAWKEEVSLAWTRL